MVVAFTSNIGLAKPDESELALNWARSTKLQEDNNIIIVDKTDINLQTYTPVLRAETTNPNIGSGGGQFGEYQDLEGLIMGRALISFFGTGVAVGLGEYGISLPAVADNTFHNVGSAFFTAPGTFSVIGEGYVYDDSSVATSGSVALDVVTVSGVSYARLITEAYTAPAKSNRLFNSSVPFAVAVNDVFTINFAYKKL